jgi:hypothetical protein
MTQVGLRSYRTYNQRHHHADGLSLQAIKLMEFVDGAMPQALRKSASSSALRYPVMMKARDSFVAGHIDCRKGRRQ